MEAAWSVHDVSPGTVAWADQMVNRLVSHGIAPLTILVIPDGDWPPAAVESLRRWEAAGHVLALHGWDHHARRPAGIYHRLHSRLLSRDAAEHLGRGREEMLARIERGRAWFRSNGLSEPAFYVPPAWALGAVRVRDLGRIGFRQVETLTAIHDTSSGGRRLLPLVGFEADTLWRSAALRFSNAVNRGIARLSGRPLRVAIHPGDGTSGLAGDLDRCIGRGWRAVLPGRRLNA